MVVNENLTIFVHKQIFADFNLLKLKINLIKW